MRRRSALVAGGLLLWSTLLLGHDLFLKLDTYFLAPNVRVRIPVLNGTFTKSEGPVAARRIADLSLVSPAGRARLAADSAWSTGPDSTSLLTVQTGGAGTYLAGVSVRPNQIELTGQQFSAYLQEDGLPDILEARRRDNELEQPARERYSKHVKAIFQVGDARTVEFGATLGYPAEIVPLVNPYTLRPGATLRVRCLVEGRPVPQQMVLWGGDQGGKPVAQRGARTDQDGVAEIMLDAPAKWYVKFIHMVRSAETGLDYESKWATLTFEVR